MAVSSSRSARFSCSMTFGLPFMPSILQEAGETCNEETQKAREPAASIAHPDSRRDSGPLPRDCTIRRALRSLYDCASLRPAGAHCLRRVELVEVLFEAVGQVGGVPVVGDFVGPGVARIENLRRHIRATDRDLQAEGDRKSTR